MGIPTTEIVHSIQGGDFRLQGTWIHPQLAIHLAQWCSAAFAVQVHAVQDFIAVPTAGARRRCLARCPADKRNYVGIRSTGLPVGAGLRHDQGVVYAGVPRLQNCPANLAARVYSIASPAGRAQFLNVVLCTALTDEMFHSPKSRPWRNRFKGIWCGTQTHARRRCRRDGPA
jgi:hypothetical protein